MGGKEYTRGETRVERGEGRAGEGKRIFLRGRYGEYQGRYGGTHTGDMRTKEARYAEDMERHGDERGN